MLYPTVATAMVALLASSPSVLAYTPHPVCPGHPGAPCPHVPDVAAGFSVVTDNNGICFSTQGADEGTLDLAFTNVFADPHEGADVAVGQTGSQCNPVTGYSTDLPGGEQVVFPVMPPPAVLPPAGAPCEVQINIAAAAPKFSMSTPAPDLTFCPVPIDLCQTCLYETITVPLPPTTCLRPKVELSNVLPVQRLRNAALDESLKQESREICESGGNVPVVDDAACQRVNPAWIRLKATFVPVSSNTIVRDIRAFADDEEIPSGTQAVGIFAGACGLADDPFRNLALIVNYCGRDPALREPTPVPPPPPPPAPADDGSAAAFAGELEGGESVGAVSEEGQALEEAAAAVMLEALGF